jgi:hypothetical protein
VGDKSPDEELDDKFQDFNYEWFRFLYLSIFKNKVFMQNSSGKNFYITYSKMLMIVSIYMVIRECDFMQRLSKYFLWKQYLFVKM